MKNIFITLLSIVCIYANAQQQSIVVDYTMTFDMKLEDIMKNVPAAQRPMVEDMFRQELEDGIEMQYQLTSNGKESYYKLQPKLNNSQGTPGLIAQQMAAYDKGVLYKNLTDMTYRKEIEFFGQNYLVVDSLPEYKWKIGREKENVAGFNARKATGMVNDSTSVTAWYTPEVAIKDGPDRYFGLPGLVVKATINMNGTSAIVTATHVAVKEEDIKIKIPSSGKEVTQKELEEEIKATIKKYSEMGQEGVDLD